MLSLEQFNQLVQHQDQNSLSIYMPTVKAGREIQQNPVRLKNTISEARSRLEEKGLRGVDIEEYLEPIQQLLSNRDYWQNQEKGLALFLASNLFEVFRLPLEFDDTLMINSRFYIKPLLPLFVENERFYLLTLSRKNLRLFVGTRFDLAEKPLPDTPTNLQEALKYDDPERELHYRAGATGSTGEGAIYHGHHPESDQNADLKRYFQLVDQGVMDVIGDQSAPLLLAGLDYLHPIYHQVNSYGNLLDRGVISNPDRLQPSELHQNAWEIMEKQTSDSRARAIERYLGLGEELTSRELEEIVPAAYHARVDTLFVDLEQAVWGSFDPQLDSLSRSSPEDPQSRDLIDLAVIHTLLKGGRILVLREGDSPEISQEGVAAILRY